MERLGQIFIVVALFLAFVVIGGRFFSNQKTKRTPAAEIVARPQAVKSPERCTPKTLRLKWPVGGIEGRDWLVPNYVDLDPTSGLRDFRGKTADHAFTYDAHTGTDIELPSFRLMDLDFPVRAAADGIVEETFDASPDRNLGCVAETWNFVRLKHANGFATIYAHLKRSSVRVRKGERVAAGSVLGVVGSSGCSRYPHLHLEVLDCESQPLDPLKESMFVDPAQYPGDREASVMETLVFQPKITSISDLQDPGLTERQVLSVGREMSVGITVAYLREGDHIRITWLDPSGQAAPFDFETRAVKAYSRSHWWGHFTLSEPGQWIAVVTINGQRVASKQVNVGR